MVKKGQAAMEFLMTYGWAILVVLVAIGALAYFGVLNPSRFLPRNCLLVPGLGCDDFKVTATEIQLFLRNGIGLDLEAVVVDGPDTCTVPTVAADWDQATIFGGATGVTISGCTNGDSGDRFKGRILVTYTTPVGATHTIEGEIVSEIEA